MTVSSRGGATHGEDRLRGLGRGGRDTDHQGLRGGLGRCACGALEADGGPGGHRPPGRERAVYSHPRLRDTPGAEPEAPTAYLRGAYPDPAGRGMDGDLAGRGPQAAGPVEGGGALDYPP